MNDIKSIEKAFEKLHGYIQKEGYRGYDPYDTLNSPFPFKHLGKWPSVLAIQFQKRNPVNIRPLLGIEKTFNPKAAGLFLHSYALLYQIDKKEKYLEKAHLFFNWLMNKCSEGYSGHCWGYNFDWASPVKFLKAHSPTIVVSGFIAKGIFEYYRIDERKETLEVLESIGKFIWEDLPRTEDESGICLSYSTKMKDCCYNASMLGAEHFARLYSITKNETYKKRAEQLSDFVVKKQHENGKWNYSIDMESGEEREQVDFHQGYVLDSLQAVMNYAKLEKESYQKAYEKGLKFYRQKQFTDEGQSLWRYPKKWPTDIHNQAQGIITFSKSCRISFAEKIAGWSIDHMMHSSEGYFYYKKYPSYKIKTPFMRWGQAWMLLAFIELFKARKECAE